MAVKAKECPGAAGTLSPCLELCQPPGGEGFMRCHHWGTPARGNTGSCQDASHDYVSLQLSQNKILGGLKKKNPFVYSGLTWSHKWPQNQECLTPDLGSPECPPQPNRHPLQLRAGAHAGSSPILGGLENAAQRTALRPRGLLEWGQCTGRARGLTHLFLPPQANQDATAPPDAMAQPYPPAQYPPPPQNGIPAEYAPPPPHPTPDYSGQTPVPPEHGMTLYTPAQTHPEPPSSESSTQPTAGAQTVPVRAPQLRTSAGGPGAGGRGPGCGEQGPAPQKEHPAPSAAPSNAEDGSGGRGRAGPARPTASSCPRRPPPPERQLQASSHLVGEVERVLGHW